MTDKPASGRIVAVNAAVGSGPPTVDASLLGTVIVGLRYPVWYTPQVGDLAVVRWLGSQPYIETVFG